MTSLRLSPSSITPRTLCFIVADGRLVVEVDAGIPQLLGDPDGIGVNDFAKQDLRAGSHDFRGQPGRRSERMIGCTPNLS